jgi:hypothetical protein
VSHDGRTKRSLSQVANEDLRADVGAFQPQMNTPRLIADKGAIGRGRHAVFSGVALTAAVRADGLPRGS